MIGRRRGIWLPALLACLFALSGAASPALAASQGDTPQPNEQVGLYGGQMATADTSYSVFSRWAMEFRLTRSITSEYSNVGIVLMDVTGATEAEIQALKIDRKLNLGSFEELVVSDGHVLDESGVGNDERVAFQKQIYDQLGLAQHPGVGRLLKVTVVNSAGNAHSEERFLDFMIRKDYAQRRFGDPFSEREPCPERCDPLVRPARFAVHYGRSLREGNTVRPLSQVNKEAAATLQSAIKSASTSRPMMDLVLAMQSRRVKAQQALTPNCQSGGKVSRGVVFSVGDPVLASAGPTCSANPSRPDPAREALVQELSRPGSSTPGGIDFSSLELRYLADGGPAGAGGLRYAFKAAPSSGGVAERDAGLRVVGEASDAFFVWLELPTWKFTVNLNPTEPNRIIDADLGRTDVGRVLLEADFNMKKTVARLIHPDTPLGADFFRQLEAGPGSEACLSLRQWIVPAPATVREVGDELYILDAPLSVKTETEYLSGQGTSAGGACANQPQAAAHNEALFRSLILPRVEQAVNQAPEYAALRRAYLSLIAADWYRRRSVAQHTAYGTLVDGGNVGPWVSRQPWSPMDIFQQYVRSYQDGEFKVTHETQRGDVIETTTYIFGGVDFTRVPEAKISAQQFQARSPNLSRNVGESLSQAVPESDGKTVWLGGATVSAGSGQAAGGRSLPPLLLLAIGGLLVLICSALFSRARRSRGS